MYLGSTFLKTLYLYVYLYLHIFNVLVLVPKYLVDVLAQTLVVNLSEQDNTISYISEEQRASRRCGW